MVKSLTKKLDFLFTLKYEDMSMKERVDRESWIFAVCVFVLTFGLLCL